RARRTGGVSCLDKQYQDDDEADEQQGLAADLAARRQRIEPARQGAHLLVAHRVDSRQGLLRRDAHLLHLLRDLRPLDEGLDALALLLRRSLVRGREPGIGLRHGKRECQQQPSENLLHLSSFERDGATAYASRKNGIKSSKPHPPPSPGIKRRSRPSCIVTPACSRTSWSSPAISLTRPTTPASAAAG